MPKRLIIGIGLLIVVAAVIAVITMTQNDDDDVDSDSITEPTTGAQIPTNFTPTAGPSPTPTLPPLVSVRGLTGGEKMGFCRNDAIINLLQNSYALEIDCVRSGSIDMLNADYTGMDYLWPSNDVVLALYEEQNVGQVVTSERLFNSPIVLYSWDNVTQALIDQGIVEQVNSFYYVVDMPRLVNMITTQTNWSDIGLNLFGPVKVISTDPTKSNSGNMFYGLLANMLVSKETGDTIANAETIEIVLPEIIDYRNQLGFLEDSSGTLFEKFLSQGAGAYPIIVGYENQIIEFILENPNQRDTIMSQIRILYPQPTVWSSHPMIALTDNGERLLEALQAPEFAELAWQQHGLRSGLSGVQSDPADLNIPGIPTTIDQVINLPSPTTMRRMIDYIELNAQ